MHREYFCYSSSRRGGKSSPQNLPGEVFVSVTGSHNEAKDRPEVIEIDPHTLETPCGFKRRKPGQADVEQYDIRFKFSAKLDCFFTGRDFCNGACAMRTFKNMAQAGTDELLVVHD